MEFFLGGKVRTAEDADSIHRGTDEDSIQDGKIVWEDRAHQPPLKTVYVGISGPDGKRLFVNANMIRPDGKVMMPLVNGPGEVPHRTITRTVSKNADGQYVFDQ